DHRARRDRQRQLEEQEFEIKQMELAARRQVAETQLRHAASLAELRGDAERHKAQAEAHRTRAEAEKLRRCGGPSEFETMPAALRRKRREGVRYRHLAGLITSQPHPFEDFAAGEAVALLYYLEELF